MQTADPSPAFVVRSDLTVKERLMGLQLAQQQARRRLGGWRWFPLVVVLGAVGMIVLGQNVPSRFNYLFSGWTSLIVLIAAFFIAFLFTTSRLHRRLASEMSSHLEVQADESHLLLHSEHASTRYPWAVVTSCEIVGEMLTISGEGFLSIAVPLRSFGTKEAAQRFAEFVRSRIKAGENEHAISATSAQASPAPALVRGKTPARDLFRDLWDNIRAGVLLLCFRSSGVQRLKPSSTQFVALVFLSAALSVITVLLHSLGQGFLNWSALPDSLFFVLMILAAAWVGASFARRSERFLPLAVGIAALGPPSVLLAQIVPWVVREPITYY